MRSGPTHGTHRIASVAAPDTRQAEHNNVHPIRHQLVSPDGAEILVGPPRGLQVATCAGENRAVIWDPETGAAIHRLAGHRGATCCLSWSSDGRWLATGSTDTSVRLWDAETGRCGRVLGTARAGR